MRRDGKLETPDPDVQRGNGVVCGLASGVYFEGTGGSGRVGGGPGQGGRFCEDMLESS